MNNDINNVSLSGTIGQEPELRYTGNGTAVLNLRLKVENVYENGEGWQSSESWFTAVVWGNNAEQINETYEEGDRIWITGELTINSWEGKDGNMNYDTQVDVDDFGTIEKAGAPKAQAEPAGQPSNQTRPSNSQPQKQRQGGGRNQTQEQTFESDDELPF